MKKLLAIIAFCAFVSSCNNKSEKTDTSDSIAPITDTSNKMMPDTSDHIMDTIKPAD